MSGGVAETCWLCKHGTLTWTCSQEGSGWLTISSHCRLAPRILAGGFASNDECVLKVKQSFVVITPWSPWKPWLYIGWQKHLWEEKTRVPQLFEHECFRESISQSEMIQMMVMVSHLLSYLLTYFVGSLPFIYFIIHLVTFVTAGWVWNCMYYHSFLYFFKHSMTFCILFFTFMSKEMVVNLSSTHCLVWSQL